MKIENSKWGTIRARAFPFFIFHFSFFISFAADLDLSKLPPPANRRIDFASDIKPIFEASCYRCHGAEKPKAKFSLTSRESALKGGQDGIDIIPGDSAKSPLIHYVAGLVTDMQMPPPDKADPLTREQVALLRAWIDQGVVWEQVDLSKQYAPQFSFTPALRYVTVSGNARKFEEHQWVRRGFSEGVSDFRVAQKRTNGVSVLAEGRAMTDDYKVTLDLRKDDVGFARAGLEQFRHYYDEHGPSYPFRASGFVPATAGIFSLRRETHLDVGKAFIEFGLTEPDWPRLVLGYEFQYRQGDESTEQWGPVAQSTNLMRHIFPARRHLDEEVHVLRLDISHDIAGVHVEDNARVEFADLKSTRANATDFSPGAAYPTEFALTRESHEQLLFANTLHGEKSIKDWLFVSAGYLFTHFDADAALHQDIVTGPGFATSAPKGGASDIVLKESAHVFNANSLLGPWEGLALSLGVLNEWSSQRGYGHQNLETDSGLPTSTLDEPTLVASDIDRLVVEEDVRLRYTGIPMTVLFAEAQLRQERSDRSDESFADHDGFLRDTDAKIDWQEYKAGFEVSPWRQFSLNASYKHRRHESDFDDRRDNLVSATSPTNFALVAGAGYPAFIRGRRTDTDSIETRLVLRPASWLKTTFSYRLALTDYDTTTDRGPTIGSVTPAGHIFAGEYDSATYSANITITPARRWYLATTLSYQESRTWTGEHTNRAVIPYRGDIWNVAVSSTFAASERTDFTAGYTFSRARFAQHNEASGLPLGIDYDLHGVQFGIAHRWTANIVSGLQYGFYKYEESAARGFNDYAAHVVFGTLAVRLP